jgi:hypothetical protein
VVAVAIECWRQPCSASLPSALQWSQSGRTHCSNANSAVAGIMEYDPLGNLFGKAR